MIEDRTAQKQAPQGQGPETEASPSGVIEYRTFRNTDPPALTTIWNESLIERGAIHLQHSTPFETHVLAKPYFDPRGLFIATASSVPVGFAHVGFGPDEFGKALSTQSAVVCAIAVRPKFRKLGIGSELLKRCEAYAAQSGAANFLAGPHPQFDPFYFSLYGGSALPGFLASDQSAAPFFARNGYRPQSSIVVLQRSINANLPAADGRFPGIRRQYDVRILSRSARSSWWQECVTGPIEVADFRLEEKGTNTESGRLSVWEMEHFGARWGQSAIGILDIQIDPALRRRGLGKYLMCQALRYLAEQFFLVTETQIPAANLEALAFFKSLGFAQVDAGTVFAKGAGGTKVS